MTTTTKPSLPLPPGSLGLPLIGETLSFFGDPDFAQKRFQQYGSIFKTQIFGKPTVFIRGTEANRFILTGENQQFEVSWPPSTKALLGKLSLALQTGDLHQKRRKLLAQAFMPRALAGYIATMEAITQQYLHRWQDLYEFAWYPELRNYTLDVACKLLVGLEQGSQTPLGHQFETWCEGLFSIPLPFPWTRFGRAKQCRDRLLDNIEQIIRQRQQSTDPGNDTLGLLVQATDEEGNHLSAEELKDQVLLLLFAGHETLTSAIASFCLLAAQHPEVLDRMRQEQQQFPADQPLTLEQLKQMTYLEQVLKEVLRLIPPVGGGFRTVMQPAEFEGYQIPQGWSVLYQIGNTHKDQKLYPNPSTFDPDRFSLERLQAQSVDQQKFGYLPFGRGIRECLGKEFARLEMKIFAVHLLRYYNWQLLPDQNLDLVTIPTPHPQDGLRVRFQKRG
ncbi:MAG: cytochrome P450 [Elainellaceae cyanobacterium]